ncbi:iron ABC transporter permease [Congregibacter brevis]|uniref:Iron ABC transporter permease n=1 Tax=Congregibacter brevis TaxID=3081201 RepID=A0ABZ0IAW1_9GAMM|nr:iron ABC transporter permease [Congregibacter sp. IMCC45268]
MALTLGAIPLSFSEVFAVLSGSGEALHETLILQLRLPRVLQAAAIGGLLALTGALSQGMFRNPLADPSLIGVTGGASLGGALVLALGIGAGTGADLSISVGAFAGGLIATGLVYQIARTTQGTSVSTLLLAGVAITALAGALVSVLEMTVDNSTLRRVAVWRLGSLAGADYHSLALSCTALALVILASLPLRNVLNAFLLGEAEAGHLGYDTARSKALMTSLIAAGMGVTVALAGAIAFVGLVVPHMVRLYSGPEHKALLPRCTLLGALVLVLADLLSRTLLAPGEIPLGIITALLGVPFFLILLRRYQSGLVIS